MVISMRGVVKREGGKRLCAVERWEGKRRLCTNTGVEGVEPPGCISTLRHLGTKTCQNPVDIGAPKSWP